MKIATQERVWWSPELTATNSHGASVSVPVTGWEASIDGGQTWKASRDNSGVPGWLVAGADYPGPGDSAGAATTDFVVSVNAQVLIRLRSTPETVLNSDLWLEV